jgi:D-galactarolactone cycloisomerase
MSISCEEHDMKIVEIRGFELRSKLPCVQGNSTGFVDHVSTFLVAIRSDDGIVGWGETWASPATASALIRRHLAPPLLGRDPRDHGVIWPERVRQRGYDRRGNTMMAISAIDLALWDATARAHDLPVWALLGGRLRDRVHAYASGPYFRTGDDPYAGFENEVEGYLREGYKATKLRLGTTPRADRAVCLAVRKAIGADALLMVDLNQGFSVRTALDIADSVAEAGIHWMEEPLPPDDLEGYRRFAAHAPFAVAAGEALAGSESFGDFIAARCIDVVQPDLAVCGGLTEALRVAAMAYAADLRVAPHVIGGFVNFYASLHFAAILPTRPATPFQRHPLFEYDQTPNALRGLVDVPRVRADGTVAIPDGPGFGFEISTEALVPLVTESWTLTL